MKYHVWMLENRHNKKHGRLIPVITCNFQNKNLKQANSGTSKGNTIHIVSYTMSYYLHIILHYTTYVLRIEIYETISNFFNV